MTPEDPAMVVDVRQRVQKTPIAVKYALLASSFIILAVVYYYSFCRFPRSSDDASVLLEGHEMCNGNWRLKGWLLPDDNFLTSAVLLYAIFGKFFGFTPLLMFCVPAIVWAAVASLSVALAQGGRIGTEKWLAMAAVATPVLLPIIRNNGAMYVIAHDLHPGTIFYVLLSFFLAKKVILRQDKHSTAMLIAYTCVMCLAVFGDTFAIFIGAIPVIVVAAYFAVYSNKSRQNLLLLLLTVLAVVVGKVLVEVNTQSGGFTIFHLPMRFVSFDDLGRNIAWAVQYFFIVFGCDFFGKDVFELSIDGPALALIRLPFLALLIAAFVLLGKKLFARSKAANSKWTTSESDYLCALLAISVTIVTLAAVFSTQMVNATSIRYFLPALVFGAILIARTQINTRWFGAYLYIALSASLAFSLSAYAQNPRGAVLMPKELDAVSNWLSNNDFSYGFGPYWSSSIITAATQNRITVRALIAAPGGKVKPWEWMADKRWFRDGAISGLRPFFVLTHDAEEEFFREADVLRTLGEPRVKHEIGAYIINIYDPTDERLRSLSLTLLPHVLREGEQLSIPMVDFYSQVGSYSSSGWQAGKNSCPPGYLIFGPYWPIDRGTYQIAVSMITSGEIGGSKLDVVARQGTQSIASTQLGDNTPREQPFTVTLNAKIKADVPDLEIRLYYAGKGTLMVTSVILRKDMNLVR